MDPKHLISKRTTSAEPEEDLSRREKDFLTYFGYLNDRLINHFSCACQSATDIILYHGRMFITERYICFSSHIIKEYLKVIPFSEVTNIVKKNTALVFSNAIGVTHKKGSEFFTSFLHRDKVFDLINTLWRKNKGEESLGINLRSLIKQEQEASKPVPDNSMPLERKPTLETIAEEIKETNERMAPELTQNNPPITIENTPASPPTSPSSPEEQTKVEEKPKKNSHPHPLDLNLLRNGKPKMKVKKNSTIPDEILEEMKNEKEQESLIVEAENQDDNQAREEQVVDHFKDVIFPESGKFADHIVIDKEPCINRVFPNVTPKEFYARLLYSQEFWEHVFVVTDSVDIEIPPFKSPSENAIHLERVCKFVAPIKGAPMGPKQTRVRQTHRVSFVDEDHIVFDTSNVSLDIPMYSDAFVVESVWDVRKEGTGCRLQIRWKVHFLKSVWVKGMIEKNAKVATEEFYSVWANEAQKELTKKKESSVSAESAFVERKSVIEDDIPVMKDPVEFGKEELMNNDHAGGEITIPLVGLQVSISMIATFAVAMLLICFGTYILLRINFIHSDIQSWKATHHELEDRLIFLQTMAARLAMDVTLEEGKEKVWGDWKSKNSDLDWRLSEWQEEIQHLQQTLSSTLTKVGQVLEYSSNKKLGVSSNPLLLSNTILDDVVHGNTKIIERVPTESSINFYFIGICFVSLIIASAGIAFFVYQ